MGKEILELANTVYWNHQAGDKDYMERAQIAVGQFPFAMRHVFVRFAEGPSLDLSTYDMDRIVSAYLKLRGIKPPTALRKLRKPVQCDFVVPNALAKRLPGAASAQRATTPQPPKKRAARSSRGGRQADHLRAHGATEL